MPPGSLAGRRFGLRRFIAAFAHANAAIGRRSFLNRLVGMEK
jgi:hypothetical protein